MSQKIAIVGATFSGNKGAAAMLQSIIKNLPGNIHFNLLSVYPKEDIEQNPYRHVQVISCKPEQIIFLAFPLSILFFLVKRFEKLKNLILKNKILKSFYEVDLVVDVAGISFVDSRGFIMNTYNFICVSTPLLLGKKVLKYSQAMGPFNHPWNRFLAKLVLPKLESIAARGTETYKHLNELGLKNVEICADGAFLMPDDEQAKIRVKNIVSEDHFYKEIFVTVSISSVVEKYCKQVGIDYKQIMSQFIDYLISEKGYGVLIIANAARKGKLGKKNNDLITCQDVYNLVKNKDKCRYYHEEFTPEEIREFIALSKMLIASRFHAMIGALYKNVPVLLIGWSHKYKEVLDMFSLSKNAMDFKSLNLTDLINEFNHFEMNLENIRHKIHQHLPEVIASSRRNIELIENALIKLGEVQ